MIIYEYSIVNAYATGNSRNIADNDSIPMYWTNDHLPIIPSGKWARYNFPGWVITDIPPPVIEAVVEPIAEQSPPVSY